eukprot:58099-Pyramimonas_sp.AAC.1
MQNPRRRKVAIRDVATGFARSETFCGTCHRVSSRRTGGPCSWRAPPLSRAQKQIGTGILHS